MASLSDPIPAFTTVAVRTTYGDLLCNVDTGRNNMTSGDLVRFLQHLAHDPMGCHLLGGNVSLTFFRIPRGPCLLGCGGGDAQIFVVAKGHTAAYITTSPQPSSNPRSLGPPPNSVVSPLRFAPAFRSICAFFFVFFPHFPSHSHFIHTPHNCIITITAPHRLSCIYPSLFCHTTRTQSLVLFAMYAS
ncbi:hypothetical protein B0H14DRAFT_1541430 [Mycena olivaceomarginata]|nr:hypothetical protein B0H14DRAFT_1541430 [Mycena olivaceomarginata]